MAVAAVRPVVRESKARVVALGLLAHAFTFGIRVPLLVFKASGEQLVVEQSLDGGVHDPERRVYKQPLYAT